MKYIFLFALAGCFFSKDLFSQVVTTKAGSGGSGYTGDSGPATNASFIHPGGVATDRHDNIYITDFPGYTVRKVDRITGIITTVAGTGVNGYSGDGGPATSAMINLPVNSIVDKSDNIYIADQGNNRIRKVNSMGIISTVAGNGTSGYTTDGVPATSTGIGGVYDVIIDDTGNLYISTGTVSSAYVLMVDTFGILHRLAGNGTLIYSGDGGPATLAGLSSATGLTLDSINNLYVSSGSSIRKINTSGIISRVAGTEVSGFSGDGGPATAAQFSAYKMAFDGYNNLYVADNGNCRIRKIDVAGIITTVVGNGLSTYAGDGSAPLATGFSGLEDVAFDNTGSMYIQAGGNRRTFYIQSPSCSGTPDAGTVSGTPTSGCGSYTSYLSLSGATVASGLTYRWQSSTDSAIWVNAPSANERTYNASVVPPVYYRCIVTCSVTVLSDTTTGIKLNNIPPVLSDISGSGAVCAGSTRALSNSTAGGIWSSGNTSVATVNNMGVVSGVSAGNVTISYSYTNTCGSSIKTTTITVNPLPVAGAISGIATVCSGNTTALSNDVTGGTWSSSNTIVATVGTSGMVQGVSVGSVTISYTVGNGCGSLSTTITLTVTTVPSLSAITGNTTVCLGAATLLSNAATGGTWSSSSTGVATVNSSGAVSGVAVGNEIVSYAVTNSCGTSVTTTTVSVISLPSPAIVTGPSQVCIGGSIQLSNSISGGAWSSNNAAIAVVGGSGVVVGVTLGNAVISYTVSNSCGASTITVSITVLLAPDPGIITGATAFCVGSVLPLSNSVSGGTWVSSNTSIATVSNTGVVSGVTQGLVPIYYIVTASCGTATASATAIVKDIPSGGIAGHQTGCQGNVIFLSAAELGGIWSSGNTSIATVSTSGIVSCIAAGVVIVSYDVANICGYKHSELPLLIYPATECNTQTAIVDNNNAGELQVYPNPGNGSFIVSVSSIYEETIEVIVSNAVGQKLRQTKAQTNKEFRIDLDNIPGMYILSAISAHKTHFIKLIVK